MKKTKIKTLAGFILLTLLLGGCTNGAPTSGTPGETAVSLNTVAPDGAPSDNSVSVSGIPENAEALISENSVVNSSSEETLEFTIDEHICARFTSYDLDTSYDENTATLLTFSGQDLSVAGEGVSADGNRVCITQAGTYILEGTLSDGQIYINAGDNDKVHLVLQGVSLFCNDGPAIYSANADKTIITLAENTENYCVDGATYYSDDANGCIYSKQDLTINGTGSLFVTGNFGNGISTKDDLRIYGATIEISAVNNGLKGNDSVSILDAIITVTGSDDGIKADNDTDLDKGYIFISNSYLDITSNDDAFQAYRAFIFPEGTIYLRCFGKDINCDGLTELGGTMIPWI